MTRQLPPLDLHAHVDPTTDGRTLESLGAVVFVALRSLEESAAATRRKDAVTVWGVGCHPGLAAAQAAYDEGRFAELLEVSPYVSEVGLDGASRVPIAKQVEVFSSILEQVARRPRLLSVHSRRATRRTLDLIERSGVDGAILHWWLGSETETRKAVELGCLFSVNRSMDVVALRGAGVPLGRLLPETDHPFADRRGDGPRQPGWTADVEQAVAIAYGITVDEVRAQFWGTVAERTARYGTTEMLPPVVQAMLRQAARNTCE